MNATTTYGIGDEVKHTAAFLRSTGWLTNVPRKGVVVPFPALDEDGNPYVPLSGTVNVRWDGRRDACPINTANIMPKRRPG